MCEKYYTIISKNEVRIRLKASCLAQWAKRRPTRCEGLVALVLIYAIPPASADICGRQLGGCLVVDHLSRSDACGGTSGCSSVGSQPRILEGLQLSKIIGRMIIFMAVLHHWQAPVPDLVEGVLQDAINWPCLFAHHHAFHELPVHLAPTQSRTFLHPVACAAQVHAPRALSILKPGQRLGEHIALPAKARGMDIALPTSGAVPCSAGCRHAAG